MRDAESHHQEGFLLDQEALSHSEVEYHYRMAVVLDPARSLYWRRLIEFLAIQARQREARACLEEALGYLRETTALYSEFHIPLCAFFIHHCYTEEADFLISRMSDEFKRENNYIYLFRNYIASLREAASDRLIFPISVHVDSWNDGPHIASRENVDRWFAGRTLWADSECVRMFLGEYPFSPDGKYMYSSVEREVFKRLSVNGPTEIPEADEFSRFVEVVLRKGIKEPEIYFHPITSGQWADDLPSQELDPLRYLKNWR